jgi:hypothetical protein
LGENSLGILSRKRRNLVAGRDRSEFEPRTAVSVSLTFRFSESVTIAQSGELFDQAFYRNVYTSMRVTHAVSRFSYKEDGLAETPRSVIDLVEDLIEDPLSRDRFYRQVRPNLLQLLNISPQNCRIADADLSSPCESVASIVRFLFASRPPPSFWRRLAGDRFFFKLTNVLLMAAPDRPDAVIGHLASILRLAPPMVRGDIFRDIGQENIRIFIRLILGSTTGLGFGFSTWMLGRLIRFAGDGEFLASTFDGFLDFFAPQVNSPIILLNGSQVQGFGGDLWTVASAFARYDVPSFAQRLVELMDELSPLYFRRPTSDFIATLQHISAHGCDHVALFVQRRYAPIVLSTALYSPNADVVCRCLSLLTTWIEHYPDLMTLPLDLFRLFAEKWSRNDFGNRGIDLPLIELFLLTSLRSDAPVDAAAKEAVSAFIAQFVEQHPGDEIRNLASFLITWACDVCGDPGLERMINLGCLSLFRGRAADFDDELDEGLCRYLGELADAEASGAARCERMQDGPASATEQTAEASSE